MRSEQEMLDRIVNTAKNDDRIRAVIMNGSRTNANVPRDIFQDFDIIYLVADVDVFKADPTWIKRFGELMIIQTPETMEDPPPSNDGSFTYLMQFTDGNRIDVTLIPIAKVHEIGNDSLNRTLLDKDGLLPPFAPSNDSAYLPKPPTAKTFDDCCNEFWWVSLNVAKGLWREEILYAKYILDRHVRDQLMKMLTWYVGMKTQFSRSPGKLGKYLKQYLEPALWMLLEKTYADASYDTTWQSLFAMCELFEKTANEVAEQLKFDYPHQEAKQVRDHLHHVRLLPKDATNIY